MRVYLEKQKNLIVGLKRGVHYNQRTSSQSSPYYWNRDMTIEYFQKMKCHIGSLNNGKTI